MSEHKRVYRKIERTPEELAELKARRQGFSRAIARVLEDLIASGDYDGPYRQGDILAHAVSSGSHSTQERGQAGSELRRMSRSVQDWDKAIAQPSWRNGKILNPTVATLWSYAGRDRHDAQVLSREGPAWRIIADAGIRNSDFTSMFESQVPASWAGLVRTPSMRIAPFSLTITAKTNGLSA